MPFTKQEAIRALTAAGYPLIPLLGKRPFEENWEATPLGKHHEKTLLEAKSYGVVLGPRDLVVDVDPRNFRDGDKPLDRLAEKIGGIPPGAFVVKTGGSGLHIYFKKPADLSVRNSLPGFPGIEFKGGPGRQVVGPGSIHPDTGAPYFHVRGLPSTVTETPRWLLDALKKTNLSAAPSASHDYHDDEATQERCASFLKTTAPAAIEGFHGDETTYKTVCALRDFGVSPKVALALVEAHYNPRCVPVWNTDDLAAKVRHAYSYAQGQVGGKHPSNVFDKINTQPAAAVDAGDQEVKQRGWKLDAKNRPVKSFQNLLNYFQVSKIGLRGVFAYNEFARCVEFSGTPPWPHARAGVGEAVQDVDLQQLRAHLARHHGYDASKEDLVDAMVDSAQAKRFHPVKTYLNGLKWDGTPRLDKWLIDYLGAQDDAEGYTRAVGRKTLCAAVARVFEPGIKFDHVLVLEGRQGIGKSGVCRILGGEWFGDFKMSVERADTVQMMQGKWIVEMAELHAARQTDVDTLKAFLTRQVDEARFAYGRLPGKYPRQSIFIASYNPGPDGTYLKDDENRRWWPVRCSPVPPRGRVFDFAGLKVVRDQLWAEACAMYKKGESLTMETETLADAAKAAQRERQATHPWAERVAEWLHEEEKKAKKDFYSSREIYVHAMNGLDSRFSRRESVDVSRAMKEIGWEPGFRKKEGLTIRGYWRPNVNGAAAHDEGEVEEKKPLDIFGDLS